MERRPLQAPTQLARRKKAIPYHLFFMSLSQACHASSTLQARGLHTAALCVPLEA